MFAPGPLWHLNCLLRGRMSVSPQPKKEIMTYINNRSTCLALLAVGFLAMGGPAASQPGNGGTGLDSTSTLNDYIEYAIANNPSVRASNEASRAGRQVPAQARALPDPMVSYSYYVMQPQTRVGAVTNALMISQMLPFFGKRSLKGEIAERRAGVLEKAYESRVLDLVRDVKAAYFDYYRVYEILQLTLHEKEILSRMQDVAQVKYASNQASQQDVLKAQLALSALDDRLTTLRRDMATTAGRLNELLYRPFEAPLASPRVDVQEFGADTTANAVAVAAGQRPELAAATLALDGAERSRSLARREYYPDLTLSLGYTWVDPRPQPVPENGNDDIMVTAAVNVPLWFQKRRAAVREAEASAAEARWRQQAVHEQISIDVRDAQARVRAAHEQVRLYEGVILPQAEQTFAASEAGYQTGRVDFLNYLDSERMLLSLKQTYYRLVADLATQHADLERALGSGLHSGQ
jgi:cobalt-zinc-cadmium efflux system outer membrane protein